VYPDEDLGMVTMTYGVVQELQDMSVFALDKTKYPGCNEEGYTTFNSSCFYPDVYEFTPNKIPSAMITGKKTIKSADGTEVTCDVIYGRNGETTGVHVETCNNG